MPKYSVTIAANVRAYATIRIRAADPDAAWARAKAVAASPHIWREPEMENAVFSPMWDTLEDLEALEDVN